MRNIYQPTEDFFYWKDTPDEGSGAIAPIFISKCEEGFTADLAEEKESEFKAAYNSGRKAAAEEIIEFLKEEGQKWQHGWILGDAANTICDMFELPELKLTDEELEEDYAE